MAEEARQRSRINLPGLQGYANAAEEADRGRKFVAYQVHQKVKAGEVLLTEMRDVAQLLIILHLRPDPPFHQPSSQVCCAPVINSLCPRCIGLTPNHCSSNSATEERTVITSSLASARQWN